jgi:hypothetical protein
MNATTALLCGIAATLLLAIGLVRASERLDPIMQPATKASSEILTAAGCMPCIPCVEPDSLSKVA